MYDMLIKPSAPIELINIVPFNPLISKCQIKVCWVGNEANHNKSIITKEVAKEMANSLPGSPIVGYYNENIEDFEEHNKIIEITNGKFRLKPTTRPYGFVDLGAKVWFQKFVDYDNIEREYLVTEGWLWTGQFPECQRVITEGNNQSMELSENYLDAHWTKDKNGNKQFFIINEAIISKLCILGENFQPCFEGANITAPKIEFSYGESFEQELYSMMKEIKNILNEGGAFMAINENTPVVEEPVVEEPVIETPVVEEPAEPVVEEPAEPVVEPVIEEPVTAEPEVKYNLDEIPEYVELQSKYNDLISAHNALVEENNDLVSFKATIVKKEKEAMIESFYMLSEEDKQDVKDNIDNYSLEDIEAKLSILCVRNKVSFDIDNNNKTTQEPISYSLNDSEITVSDVPEWIRAVQAVANND